MNHKTRPLRTLALITALGVSSLQLSVRAYESGTTHAGMTGQAILQSDLHRFLQSHGLPLGLFTPLRLRPDILKQRRIVARLRHQLFHLDTAGGARPNRQLEQWALGWVLAGSILQDVPPAADRNHFYSPVARSGLTNPIPAASPVIAILSAVEGRDSLRSLFTGGAFHLSGESALSWIYSSHNPSSVEAFYRHLAAALHHSDTSLRHHEFALALLSLGGILHVLQDMASPTHVRNDFAVGHLQRLGRSTYDRGSAYERYVAHVYGRTGIRPYRGMPIRRKHVRDYFSSADGTGLADITHVSNFSPGTLPATIALRRIPSRRELQARLAASLRYASPAIGEIDPACPQDRTCYLIRAGRPLLAYRVDSRHQLRFFLDRSCFDASAQQLIPLAVGFSTGLVDHLLRNAEAAKPAR